MKIVEKTEDFGGTEWDFVASMPNYSHEKYSQSQIEGLEGMNEFKFEGASGIRYHVVQGCLPFTASVEQCISPNLTITVAQYEFEYSPYMWRAYNEVVWPDIHKFYGGLIVVFIFVGLTLVLCVS